MRQKRMIFCLEGVEDESNGSTTIILQQLEVMAMKKGLGSVYRACDSIEGLVESLNILLYDDNNFKDYEIIYLVMSGKENSISLNDYYYSFEEIAELFDGKMKGKIIHFANTKVLELDEELAQYFLDITGARAVSGYGTATTTITSQLLDVAFFEQCQKEDDVTVIVESLFEKHYALCQYLDFRMYY